MSSLDDHWKRAATGLIKSLLSLKGIKYPELSQRLQRMGIDESPASISAKINRGSFKATFLLQVLKAIEMQHITVTDLN